MTTSSRVCLKASMSALPLRSSCCFMPQFLMPLPNALLGPLWMRSSCSEGMVGQMLNGGGKILQGINIVCNPCSQLTVVPCSQLLIPKSVLVAPAVSSCVAPLGTLCTTLKIWSCWVVSICMACVWCPFKVLCYSVCPFLTGLRHGYPSILASNFSWLSLWPLSFLDRPPLLLGR
jgi:hypothetical protein